MECLATATMYVHYNDVHKAIDLSACVEVCVDSVVQRSCVEAPRSTSLALVVSLTAFRMWVETSFVAEVLLHRLFHCFISLLSLCR